MSGKGYAINEFHTNTFQTIVKFNMSPFYSIVKFKMFSFYAIVKLNMVCFQAIMKFNMSSFQVTVKFNMSSFQFTLKFNMVQRFTFPRYETVYEPVSSMFTSCIMSKYLVCLIYGMVKMFPYSSNISAISDKLIIDIWQLNCKHLLFTFILHVTHSHCLPPHPPPPPPPKKIKRSPCIM